MRPIQTTFILIFLLISGLWLLAERPVLPMDIQAFHTIFAQYFGILSISLLSINIFLATRPRWLESRLHGLDKMYRLHKWLGISLLVTVACHWLTVNVLKIAVQFGFLAADQLQSPVPPTVLPQGIEGFFLQQRPLAIGIAGLALLLVSALIFIALIKKIPYRTFAKLHHWIVIPYFMLAYHAIIMTQFNYWSQPIGWLLALFLIVGIFSALLVLMHKVGKKQQVQAELTDYNYHPDLKVIEANFKLNEVWKGHQAGQFAFITSSAKEGAHPFSISSAWNPADPKISFIAKELGDYTKTLPAIAKVNGKVTIEGPYGHFTFDDQKPVHIWVAGGIGITPFVARLSYLAQHTQERAVYFFYSTAKTEQSVIDRLTALAQAAQIQFHLQLASRDGRLTADFIREHVPNWQNASIWFCGPAGFGDALRTDFKAHGLKAGDFHQELFEFR